jgi:hypothetical protein
MPRDEFKIKYTSFMYYLGTIYTIPKSTMVDSIHVWLF